MADHPAQGHPRARKLYAEQPALTEKDRRWAAEVLCSHGGESAANRNDSKSEPGAGRESTSRAGPHITRRLPETLEELADLFGDAPTGQLAGSRRG